MTAVSMPEPHARVLSLVSRELTAAGVRHGVGGSGLLALLGLPVSVRDLDIEIGAGDLPAVTAIHALRNFEVTHPYLAHGAIITTGTGEIGGGRMYRGVLDGVLVEIFEHPGLRVDGRWAELPLRLAGMVTVGGDEIPLADSAFWWALYSRIAPGKADLLAPLVPDAERARAAGELGLQYPSSESAG